MSAIDEAASRLEIFLDCKDRINYACQQNSVPIIEALSISLPDGMEGIGNCTLTLRADPEFTTSREWHIDILKPGSIHEIRDRDFKLNSQFLIGLDEAVNGELSATITDAEGNELAHTSRNVRLLARNEWGGLNTMPELLPAFVMPNDPAIAKILSEASRLLRKRGKPDTLDGYKSNSRKRIWELTSAIYAAVSARRLTYAVPPASFEIEGQKIRMPSQVLSDKISTCLDSTILFASAIEAAALRAIIVLTKGHSFVGVWLKPESFPAIVEDQAEFLRKAVDLNDLLLFETTYVTQETPPLFKAAIYAANERIKIDVEHNFEMAIDVSRARAHKIHPLASGTRATVDSEEINIEQTAYVEDAPDLPDFESEADDEEEVRTPEGRLERWQRKLLDLTLKNRLLNYRESKKSIKIACPDPGLLEDKLAAGRPIKVKAMPQIRGREQQDEELHHQKTGVQISEEYALDALERNEVITTLERDELDKRLVNIYRAANAALAEGGSNTLFLALGFLLWKDDKHGEKRFKAPLILVPVSVERKSVRSGVKIKSHDDQSRFNTTLLEMLRRDFRLDIKGLDEDLPKDTSGVDVKGIWDTVRHSIRSSEGFEVVEDVVLGHFSFAKYLMWKDLVDRTDTLRENGIVAHLLDAKEALETSSEGVRAGELDSEFKPKDLLTPLPADSSQLAAVASADRGRDFVLEGPPGTGKSQTISNMIAHFLGTGKRVLFVSEKIAALNVVHRRLREIGLGEFCLELHSSKANKKAVLSRLNDSWTVSTQKTEERWQREAGRLYNLRLGLNEVVKCLHKTYQNDMTIHYAMGVVIRDKDIPYVALSWVNRDAHSGDDMANMRDVTERLGLQALEVGDISTSLLKCIAKGHWSPSWAMGVVEKAQELKRTASNAKRQFTEVAEKIRLSDIDVNEETIPHVIRLFSALLSSCGKRVGFSLQPFIGPLIENLMCGAGLVDDFNSRFKVLSTIYDRDGWRRIDAATVANEWAEANDTWWPKSFFAKVAVRKKLTPQTKGGKPDPANDIPILGELHDIAEKIDELGDLSLNPHWKGIESDTSKVREATQIGSQLRQANAAINKEIDAVSESRRHLLVLVEDGNDMLALDSWTGTSLTNAIESLESFDKARQNFLDHIGGQDLFLNLPITEEASTYFGQIDIFSDAIVSRQKDLKTWCDWRKVRNEASDLGLKNLAYALESGLIEPNLILETFEANYCRWWSNMVIEQDEVLREFSSPEHQRKIEQFRELDDAFSKTTAQYIRAKIGNHAPKVSIVRPKSEWGVLKREIQKKMRHKPVRALMEEIPTALTTLAPCMMMSPLSIAQYLPANHKNFDVVIFDEASQIPTWDAIGALARGAQVIVAGDPKQMPPSRGFQRRDDDDDMGMGSDYVDLESILDEMIASAVPVIRLDWHYRSRNESLIAFSNAEYYDGRLVTFPAPEVQDSGVLFVKGDNLYTPGIRTNEGEAKEVVSEIVRRLTDPDPAVRQQTIGVVTFNVPQQQLIENLLDQARMERPEIEPFFLQEQIEPVFVKNLESVQGDERDVILFSISFAPREPGGRVSLNFGELSRQGGERRLNVAITRARSQMVIFSSTTADMIDTKRTSMKGVRDFKNFLDFAQRGARALAEVNMDSVGDYDSPFEVAVARYLKDKGWEVVPQIGVSRFRIDLGIVHPEKPGRYLAGIECDGATYHSSATARDRDKIRQLILENLGWKVLRIWSTDWWHNPEHAIESIHDSLEQILEQERMQEEKNDDAKTGIESADGDNQHDGFDSEELGIGSV